MALDENADAFLHRRLLRGVERVKRMVKIENPRLHMA